MTLSGILGAFALLSLVLTLWQWLAARRFPLHHRHSDKSSTPSVTLLKPVKGADEHTEACLRSWFARDYAGEMQILFAVAGAEDAACPVIKKLISEFPECDVQLVICPEQLGSNAKVSKLIQLKPLTKHEFIVVSDADLCPSRGELMCVVGLLLTRLTIANDMIWRLTRRGFGFANLCQVWVKDLLQVALWAGAFMGGGVEWRGARMQLRRDGTLLKK